jgi:3-hydroxyacyl-[acyl-carrier-protein] dehydratase
MTPDLTAALLALPHGRDFRFVDRLEKLDPGRSATGVYTLPASASFLAGHFPDHPLMPGVLMVEALAQVAGIAAQTDPSIPPLQDLRLAAIRQCKIFGTLAPEGTLHVDVTITGRMGHLIQAAGTVTDTQGTTLLEGQVTLSGQSEGC